MVEEGCIVRYVSADQILAFVRISPGATLREITEHFYPPSEYLPCDVTFGLFNTARKLNNLAAHGAVVNINPGRGKKGRWEAVA